MTQANSYIISFRGSIESDENEEKNNCKFNNNHCCGSGTAIFNTAACNAKIHGTSKRRSSYS